MMDPNPEVGRELRASDLRPKEVVVICPPGRGDLMFTLWVYEITATTVTFFAGDLNWHVINFIKSDGTIIDDQQRTVRVFEYLGEV